MPNRGAGGRPAASGARGAKRDADLREGLLAAGGDHRAFDALVAEVGADEGFPLLDLVAEMSREAKEREVKR